MDQYYGMQNLPNRTMLQKQPQAPYITNQEYLKRRSIGFNVNKGIFQVDRNTGVFEPQMKRMKMSDGHEKVMEPSE
jgi:hypothetical protein